MILTEKTKPQIASEIAELKEELFRLRRKARAHKRGLKDQQRAIEVWKKRYYEQLSLANQLSEALDEIASFRPMRPGPRPE